jgi:N-acetylmuramoyl-L-alanine amidase
VRAAAGPRRRASGTRDILQRAADAIRALIAAVAVLVLPGAGDGSAADLLPEVTSIRFGHESGRTRVVLDLDRPIAFHVQAIDGPPRLVVDLPEVRWRIGNDPLGNPRGLATGHRHGRFDAGRSRLVVDLAHPFKVVDSFTLPPRDGTRKFRLVVDIEPTPGMPSPGTPGGASLAAITPPSDPAPPVRSPALHPAPRPDPAVKPVIVLDPGHGGVDPGARATTGVDEKDVTLAVGLELRDRLLATGRYRVRMTRERDEYVALRDRIRIARDAGAALFISLHADSIPGRDIRGASVYTLSDQASDAEAARLAAAENRADILAGADLSYQDPLIANVLLDISRRDTSNSSIEFAEILVDELGEVTNLIRNTRRFAGFVVLKSPDTPSVLVELGYLSHPEDARALQSSRERAKLVTAIQRAVDRQFGLLK